MTNPMTLDETTGRNITVIKSIVAGTVAGLMLALVVVWLWNRQSTASSTAALNPFVDVSGDRVNPDLATASLKPEDVVRLQLASLRAAATDPNAIVDCYSLASPENRSMTGPLERFSQLVRSPDYRIMIGHQNAIVGRTVFVEPQGERNLPGALVLVTVTNATGDASSFQFFLEKQQAAPYRDCWMTAGVVPALPRPTADATSPVSDEVDGRDGR